MINKNDLNNLYLRKSVKVWMFVCLFFIHCKITSATYK